MRWAAAEPAAVVAPQRTSTATYYLNKLTIQCRFSWKTSIGPMLQEIQLWCKESPPPRGRRGQGPAHADRLQLPGAQGRRVLFTMVTVDRQGKCVPADIAKEEPAMAVVVDTQAPQLDPSSWQPAGRARDPVRRSGHASGPGPHSDAIPDRDKLFRDLEPVQDRPNTWCIPAQANITGQLRFFASDLAGNVTTRECTWPIAHAAQVHAGKVRAGCAPDRAADRAAERAMIFPGEKLGHRRLPRARRSSRRLAWSGGPPAEPWCSACFRLPD